MAGPPACGTTLDVTLMSVPFASCTSSRSVSMRVPAGRITAGLDAESASTGPRPFDGWKDRQRFSAAAHPSAQLSVTVSVPSGLHVTSSAFEHESAAPGVQNGRHPACASHPPPHSWVSYESPVALQTSAASPSQAANVSGVHCTARQCPGSPPMTPSMSQNGNAGSLHARASQTAAGFGRVHAVHAHNNKPQQAHRHMDRE